jgi:hypothetical protein
MNNYSKGEHKSMNNPETSLEDFFRLNTHNEGLTTDNTAMF